MARTRIPYAKQATDYDEQIRILRSHGVAISDETKAKEILSDIGYYRLGFYIHPFETTYPLLDISCPYTTDVPRSITSYRLFAKTDIYK